MFVMRLFCCCLFSVYLGVCVIWFGLVDGRCLSCCLAGSRCCFVVVFCCLLFCWVICLVVIDLPCCLLLPIALFVIC